MTDTESEEKMNISDLKFLSVSQHLALYGWCTALGYDHKVDMSFLISMKATLYSASYWVREMLRAVFCFKGTWWERQTCTHWYSDSDGELQPVFVFHGISSWNMM